MAGLRDLPRGTGCEGGDSPLATARWMSPEEVAEYAYQPGDLWLGTLDVPSEEAAREIEQLRARQEAIALDTCRDSDERRAEIDALEEEIIALAETDQMAIGIRDDRHHLVVAGSRAGKTTTLLTPTLARYPGSAAAIDPKGEVFRMTGAQRSAPGEDGGSARPAWS